MKTTAQKLSVLALGILVTAASGCVATQPPLSSGLREESQSAGSVQIHSVQLRSTAEGLQVYGTVRRSIGYNSSSQRHLDVAVRGPGNEVLLNSAISFFPNPIRYSRFSPANSSYALTLPRIPPAGSVILVTVHPTSLGECQFVATTK